IAANCRDTAITLEQPSTGPMPNCPGPRAGRCVLPWCGSPAMSMQSGASIGPYRIIEQIGRGGMATVYKAFQPALARYVAIKVLPAFFAEEPTFRERFRQEAIAVAKLRHPNILVIFDYGEEGGVTYLVSEFVEGGTLAGLLGRPIFLARTLAILGPIAAALDFAHHRGILHRDIKPSNILITDAGLPVLSDFGLAKMMGRSE